VMSDETVGGDGIFHISFFIFHLSSSRQPSLAISDHLTHHSSLIFLPRINKEQSADDYQHRGFHEDEEARNKGAVFVVSVGIGDQRS
jgi:hypothetical protein